MTDYENKENTGVLFENDKGDNPKRPDYKGSINVDGQDYWLSMWEKVSKKGTSYFSLSVQPKDEVTETKSGYEKAKEARQQLVKEVLEENPINLNDIPF